MDAWIWALSLLASSSAAAALTWYWLRHPRRPGTNDGESPLEFLAAHIPVAILLFSGDGLIKYANAPARSLLFGGENPEGQNFLRLLDTAPAPVCEALTGSKDALFTLDDDGEQQVFQLLRRDFEFGSHPHTLLMLNPLTREVARHEAEVLKKVIRVINHELNNSLASMSSLVSSARFIAEHPDKLATLGRVLDGIEARTAHLQKFLSEYAQLSRLPKPRPGKVHWDRMLTRLREMYPEAEIHDVPEDGGEYDEIQIEQALINLLKNANESGSEPRKVRVVFRTVERSLEIGVLDRGKGFSQEALRQGLLPFYSTKDGGSGVGLALCREIVGGHSGTLRIKNRESGGSAVYLVLPLDYSAPDTHRTVSLTLTHT